MATQEGQHLLYLVAVLPFSSPVRSGSRVCSQRPEGQIWSRPVSTEEGEADPVRSNLAGFRSACLECNGIRLMGQSIAYPALTYAQSEDPSIRHERNVLQLRKRGAVGHPLATSLSSRSEKRFSCIGMAGRSMLGQIPYDVAIVVRIHELAKITTVDTSSSWRCCHSVPLTFDARASAAALKLR